MSTVYGVPISILRDGDPNQPGTPDPLVRALLADGTYAEATYSGAPPCPLVPAVFWNDGQGRYHCEGPLGTDVRPVLREHFTRVPTVTADGTAACDTTWNVDVNGASSQVAALTGSALGVAQLTAGNASGRYAQLYKDTGAVLPTAVDGLWLSARLTPTGTITSYVAACGLGVSGVGFADFAGITFDTSVVTVWNLLAEKDSSATTTSTATTAAADDYVWLDVIVVTGDFVAGWVDGDGPYVATSNVITSDTVTPMVVCESLTTSTRALNVDAMFVDAIDGTILHPSIDPLLTGVRA